MLDRMALVQTFTEKGEKKTCSLFWDYVTHCSMLDIATKDSISHQILIGYPAAITGMVKNHPRISKENVYEIPIQSIVAEPCFITKLHFLINSIIKKENNSIRKYFKSLKNANFAQDDLKDSDYPIFKSTNNDLSPDYLNLVNEYDARITSNTIVFNMGVMIQCVMFDPDINNKKKLIQLNLLISKNSPLFGSYSMEAIKYDLIPFFSDAIAWLFEHEKSDMEIYVSTAPSFSTIQTLALSPFFKKNQIGNYRI